MTIIFQINQINELEEISHWLAERNIVVQNLVDKKISAEIFLKNIRRYKIQLPKNYHFNRDEANER